MTGKADRRRPLAVAIALAAAVGAALVVPVVIGAQRGAPIAGTSVRADSRESVTLSAPLRLFTSPNITLEKGTVALVGPAPGESKVGALLRTLISGGGADLVVDDATIVVDRSEASAPEATVAPAPAAPQAGEAAPASEELRPVVAALSHFKFQSLTLLNTTIVVKTAQGTTETLARVSAEIAAPDRAGLVATKGRFHYRGEPMDFDLAFTARDAAEAPVEVRASVRSRLLAAAFNGRLAPGVRGITADNAELTVTDLRSAARWLGAVWPSGPGLGAFAAKGRLTLDDRAVSFEHAEFTLDGNVATGALTAKLGPERPSIEGTLAFATFDITPYAAPQRPFALVLASDWLLALPIPGLAAPSVLRETDADIRLSAGNVVKGSERLGRLAASLSVKGGKMYGEIAELELDQGGSGEGQFTIDMTESEPRFTLRAELDDLDLSTVAVPRLGPAVVDGAGDIRLDLAARGASEADVLGSLSGTLSFDMTEGGRIGLDVDALPAAAAAEPAGQGWGAAGAGTTSVSRFTARFTAADGILTADAVEAALDDRSLTATGTVDIDNSALDLLLSIAPAPAATAPPPGRAVGAFRIRGPWAAPAISRAEPGKAASSAPSGLDPG